MFTQGLLLKPYLGCQIGVVSEQCQPLVFQDWPYTVNNRQTEEVFNFYRQLVQLFQPFSNVLVYQVIDLFHATSRAISYNNKRYYKAGSVLNPVRKLRDFQL